MRGGQRTTDIQEICRIACMSRATFYRALRQYKEEGAVHNIQVKETWRPLRIRASRHHIPEEPRNVNTNVLSVGPPKETLSESFS